MQKIVLIALSFAVMASCAVSRKKPESKGTLRPESDYMINAEDILRQNLCTQSFYIEKFEYSFKGLNGERSGYGSIKYKQPGIYLISVRSKTGIEAVRIYIKKDSIYVNDRISRKLYVGSDKFLRNQFGISLKLLPVILGDLVAENDLNDAKINCINGNASFEVLLSNELIRYMVDCNHRKIVSITAGKERYGRNISIKYDEFVNGSDYNFPGKIEIVDNESNTNISLNIVKIIKPWDGDIDFIPGKQYEIIELL